MSMGDRLGAYPYHVLGSQGLSWSRRGLHSQEKGLYLKSLLVALDEGLRKFPGQRDLRLLHRDLRREYLEIAVPKRFS